MALQLDFTRFASTLAFNLWGSWMCFFPGNRNSPLPPDFFPTWIQRAGGFSTQNRVFGFQQKAGNVYPCDLRMWVSQSLVLTTL